jgi:uncharacterized pyridoxal phosphate-containing UPF0001 family protein
LVLEVTTESSRHGIVVDKVVEIISQDITEVNEITIKGILGMIEI